MLFQRLVFLPGKNGNIVELAGFLLGIISFLHSQFFREVRLHIDAGAPDGIAFQRVLLRDIALFGKQRPDGVHVRRRSLRGGQHAQRRSHHVTSELRGQCLIPAANFCAQFLLQTFRFLLDNARWECYFYFVNLFCLTI